MYFIQSAIAKGYKYLNIKKVLWLFVAKANGAGTAQFCRIDLSI